MKKVIFILSIFFASIPMMQAQSAPSAGIGMAKEMAASKSSIDFSAEVSGQMLIITFDNIPQTGFDIEIYDITGKRVASFKSDKVSSKRNEFSFNQNLPSGLYIVRITAAKQAAVKKFQI